MTDYMLKCDEVLHRTMTEEGFNFWLKLRDKIPPCWFRLTSSTRKHHVKEDGRVPTVVEHTYEMLYTAEPLLSIFNVNPKTRDADVLMLSIMLHDSLKYGVNPTNREYTLNEHDRLIANTVQNNKKVFLKLFTEEQYDTLEDTLRYHAGRWATDAKNKDFNFRDVSPKTLFIHMLDMLSSRNLIKVNGVS
jgi:hypothetical protein